MLLRLLVTGLLIGLVLPAQDQKPRLTSLTQIPDYAIYDSFFFRVTALEEMADKADAQGRDGGSLRSEISRQAGLTREEESTVKSTAAAWRATNAALVTAQRNLIASGARPGNSSQLQDLVNQRKQLAIDYTNQLRRALGSGRFQKLDGFVRRTSTVRGFEVAQPPK
jgi:hypothetical protein